MRWDEPNRATIGRGNTEKRGENNNRHDIGDAVCAKIFMYFHCDRRHHPFAKWRNGQTESEMHKTEQKSEEKNHRKSNQAVATHINRVVWSACVTSIHSPQCRAVFGPSKCMAAYIEQRPFRRTMACRLRRRHHQRHRRRWWSMVDDDDNKYAADAFSNIFFPASASCKSLVRSFVSLLLSFWGKRMAPNAAEKNKICQKRAIHIQNHAQWRQKINKENEERKKHAKEMSTKSLCKQENECSSYCWRLVDLSFFGFLFVFFLFFLRFFIHSCLRSFWDLVIFLSGVLIVCCSAQFSPFACAIVNAWRWRSHQHIIRIAVLFAPVGTDSILHPLPSDVDVRCAHSQHTSSLDRAKNQSRMPNDGLYMYVRALRVHKSHRCSAVAPALVLAASARIIIIIIMCGCLFVLHWSFHFIIFLATLLCITVAATAAAMAMPAAAAVRCIVVTDGAADSAYV